MSNYEYVFHEGTVFAQVQAVGRIEIKSYYNITSPDTMAFLEQHPEVDIRRAAHALMGVEERYSYKVTVSGSMYACNDGLKTYNDAVRAARKDLRQIAKETKEHIGYMMNERELE